MKKASILSRVSALTLLAASTAFAVTAQEVSAADDANETAVLDPVLVTAQKRAQDINDVGMAITNISGEQLETFGIEDASDLATITPGLTFRPGSDGSSNILSLRGVGFINNNLASSSTVAVYNDQVLLPFQVLNSGEVFDVERVELLKGPQGTLFGRNTTGGALNYIVNKPTEAFAAGVSASYASFDEVDLEGYISGPISDSLRVRLSGKSVTSDGWQKSISRPGDTNGKKDFWSIRGQLAGELSEALDFNLTVNYWENQGEAQAPRVFAISNQAPGSPAALIINSVIAPLIAAEPSLGAREAGWNASQSNALNRDFFWTHLTLNYEISDRLSLTSTSSYIEYNDDGSTFDLSGHAGIPQNASIPNFLIPNPGPNDVIRAIDLVNLVALGNLAGVSNPYVPNDPLVPINNSKDDTIESFTQEVRLNYVGDRLTANVGAFFTFDESEENWTNLLEFTSSTNFGPAAGAQASTAFAVQDAQSWSIFAHGEYDLSDAIKLTLGARYTDDRKDFEGCSKDVFGDIALTLFGTAPEGCFTGFLTGNAGLVTDELNEDSLSLRLGLDYAFNENLLTYISISRGFKAGSFLTTNATAVEQLAPVTQEELLAYEAGFKATTFNNRAQINGSVYYYDYKDKQLAGAILTPPFGLLGRLENGDGEVYGAELDVLARPIDELTVGGSIAWNDTEVTNFITDTRIGNQNLSDVQTAGDPFNFAPELQFVVFGLYERPVSGTLDGYIGFDYSWTDEIRTSIGAPSLGLSVDPESTIDSYGLLGLNAGIRNPEAGWSFEVFVDNATDELYDANKSLSADSRTRYLGRPTEYGAKFKMEF